MPKTNRKPGVHLHKTMLHTTIGGDKISEYYWILIAKNGKTIVKSSETYKTKRAAVASIRIAANIFSLSAGAIGYNYYDHSLGKFQPDFVPY